MTGFGSASTERPWGTATLDLSSVNHRYQEISVRLPKELAPKEPWLHQRLRRAFRRGKVSARVEIVWAPSALSAKIDREMLTNYYHEISAVRDSLGVERDISLDALITLPGVISGSARLGIESPEEAEALLAELADAAIASWNEMRATEGAHLKDAVCEHLGAIEALADRIAARWAQAKDAAFDAMKERITRALEACGVPSPSDDRFAQEAAIIADRWDIAEELARLDSHIKKFRAAGDSDEPAGRKLDFIAQEMNREINTINSKAADADIRYMSVEAKASLERVREQIQNLE